MHTESATSLPVQTTAATIGRGTAVHAVRYDEDRAGYGLVLRGFGARTLCGQVAAGSGYRTRPNAPVEVEVSCKKCMAKLA